MQNNNFEIQQTTTTVRRIFSVYYKILENGIKWRESREISILSGELKPEQTWPNVLESDAGNPLETAAR